MTETTLMDKINIILNLSNNPKMIIVLTSLSVIFIGLIILAILINQKNASKIRSVVFIIGASFIASIIITYYQQIKTLFDFMINNIFINIYFPNITIYCLTIIITNIIIFVNLYSLKTPKLLKIINIIVYMIISYLMLLIYNIIDLNKINIFAQNSLLGNEEAQALIELSSCIFTIWILFLIIYFLIRKSQNKSNIEIKDKNSNDSTIPILEEPCESENSKIRLENTVKKLETQSQDNIIANDEFSKKDVSIDETEKLKLDILNKQKEFEKYKQTVEILNEKSKQSNDDQINMLNSQIKTIGEKLRTAEQKIEQQENINRRLSEDKTNLLNAQIRISKEKEKLEKSNQNLKNQINNSNKQINVNNNIMAELDSTFTLDDYKYLLTILKEKQKSKLNHEYNMSVLEAEPLKFSQIQEAYKSTK